jgi:uncharacterized Ntn-hydrolase superfamily protein
MKKTFQLLVLLALPALLCAQDTFSIAAVDSITGEVGSAGASCIAGSKIISDVLPGRGVIHTQSYYVAGNQVKARNQMLLGRTPAQIMGFMGNDFNDVGGNAAIRQYGVADLSPTGSPRAAAFTGASCFDYKNHIVGKNYAIQGNILSGQAILDSMEARFLAAQGSLADRLMEALQGANEPGADTRCLAGGTSSLSAFIRVAKRGDTTGTFYLDLNVNSSPVGKEPIDSLQKLFTAWKSTLVTSAPAETLEKYQISPNPNTDGRFTIADLECNERISLFDADLHLISEQNASDGTPFSGSQLSKGAYFVVIRDRNGQRFVRKVLVQ